MSGDQIVLIAGIVAALALATRGMRGGRLATGSKVRMALAWLVIIALLAFIMSRVGP